MSTFKLRSVCEARGVVDPKDHIDRLKSYDPETDGELEPRPPEGIEHVGRSFYTQAAFAKLERDREEAAKRASESEAATEPGESIAKKSNRQEEARLVSYVRDALEELYVANDFVDEETQVVFDVHNRRARGDLENVDVLAVLWRSRQHADIATVEVKLEFTAGLVQQANNYRRFSNRVWIACPVKREFCEAATELREQNPRLFDYVIDQGIGILACRMRQGRKYDVAPIQWPQRLSPDPHERDELIQVHEQELRTAGLVLPNLGMGYTTID